MLDRITFDANIAVDPATCELERAHRGVDLDQQGRPRHLIMLYERLSCTAGFRGKRVMR
jgi:hypothetical protein